MEYIIHLITLVLIYAILGVSLNLVLGYTGLLSVTHAAFFGTGAYTAAILLTKTGLGFLPALGAAVVVTACISFLIGVILSRFNDDYYALGSMGFAVIAFSVFLNWDAVTRGPLGIPQIPKPEIFGIDFSSAVAFLVLATVILFCVYFMARFIAESSFGRVLKAIREDEGAIRVFGYNTMHYKLVVFMLSAAMAAIAGTLFATYITYIDPSAFSITESIFLLAIVILGGLANLRGSILGALILVLLPEILRFVGFPSEVEAQTRELIYGALLILLMLYHPRGLLGEYKL